MHGEGNDMSKEEQKKYIIKCQRYIQQVIEKFVLKWKILRMNIRQAYTTTKFRKKYFKNTRPRKYLVTDELTEAIR